MKPRVFVTRVLPKEAMDRINLSCDAKVWGGELPPPREVLLENIRDIEGLLCLLTDKIDGAVGSGVEVASDQQLCGWL